MFLKSLYSDHQNRFSKSLRVLAHPSRAALIEQIAERHQCLNENMAHISVDDETTIQHLKALKQAGYLTGTIKGRKVYCCVNWERLEELKNEVNQFYTLMMSYKVIGDDTNCIAKQR